MPRKKAAPGEGGASTSKVAKEAFEEEAIGIDKFELPKSVITKLSKGALPQGISLQKDVTTGISKSAVVFVNYLAALAHDHATSRGRKTVAADDVLEAIKDLGWDDSAILKKKLKRELKAYRAIAEAKKNGTYTAPSQSTSQAVEGSWPPSGAGAADEPVKKTNTAEEESAGVPLGGVSQLDLDGDAEEDDPVLGSEQEDFGEEESEGDLEEDDEEEEEDIEEEEEEPPLPELMDEDLEEDLGDRSD